MHGHTPGHRGGFLQSDRRIGIDTGAYATGVLTAVRLNDASRAVLQSTASTGRVSGLEAFKQRWAT